ncbi:hypothetical protein HAX54_045653 [Datura stramonium]|uniref:Uncharacterized protein n=1 Tax=Datura stramonium TaxID=4076 RepID=A0ABS8RPI2_DATST|nr:hypothetical protein [Datura stramonium]
MATVVQRKGESLCTLPLPKSRVASASSVQNSLPKCKLNTVHLHFLYWITLVLKTSAISFHSPWSRMHKNFPPFLLLYIPPSLVPSYQKFRSNFLPGIKLAKAEKAATAGQLYTQSKKGGWRYLLLLHCKATYGYQLPNPFSEVSHELNKPF